MARRLADCCAVDLARSGADSVSVDPGSHASDHPL